MLEEGSVTKIYFNAMCSKCREALCFLQDAKVDVEVMEYTKTPMTRVELENLIDLLGIKPFELVRVKEEIFMTKLNKRSKTRYDWVGAMLKYPELMERPIFIKNKRAVIGRPPVKVLNLL